MRSLVIHESSLVLDFAADNFGGSEQTALIDEWRERDLRRHPVREGEFICHFHRHYERPALYLQARNDGKLTVACHWRGSGLAGSHEITHGITPEHERQKEYTLRAGERAGFPVGSEVSFPGVRPDGVIYGPRVHMGVEIQRSALSVPQIKRRTTMARRASVESVWFSDARNAPPWMWKVPSVRMNPDTNWSTVPKPRSVMIVSGVRAIVPKRCRNIRNGTCPRRRYGCNDWHPDVGDPFGTWVDDLAEQIPAGKLLPMLYCALSGNQYIIIASKNDKARYEQMIGRSADVPLAQRERVPQEPRRIECGADAGAALTRSEPNFSGLPIRRASVPSVPRHDVIEAPALAPTRCNAHKQWPDHPFRCRVSGCLGSEPPAEVD